MSTLLGLCTALILSGGLASSSIEDGSLPYWRIPCQVSQPSLPLGPRWLPDSVGKWAPMAYTEARRYGVDPDLLLIVVTVESYGDPNAVSEAGALGLTQIMPATARGIAAEKGLANFKTEELFNPRTALNFAAWHIRGLRRTYAPHSSSAESIRRIAVAYSGGHKQVRRWQQGLQISSGADWYQRTVLDMWLARNAESSRALNEWKESWR